MGAGLGVAMIFFAMDLLCRVIPAIKNLKYFTPFYFCNATDIFTDVEISAEGLVIAVLIILLSCGLSVWYYVKKDLQ